MSYKVKHTFTRVLLCVAIRLNCLHMKLIIGLGNPGSEYEQTRHNVGFTLIDLVARSYDAQFQVKPKFKGNVAEANYNGEKILLLKPSTFYNLSGEAAYALKDFYKIDSTEILAIHDELALPFGTIRVRPSGSDAGNKGVRSLNQHLGIDYMRLRVGVHHEIATKIPATDFVLGRFTKQEHELVTGKLLECTREYASQFLNGQLTADTTVLQAET